VVERQPKNIAGNLKFFWGILGLRRIAFVTPIPTVGGRGWLFGHARHNNPSLRVSLSLYRV
jgi:hypothetical protein